MTFGRTLSVQEQVARAESKILERINISQDWHL